jgi:ribosomal protein S18 acetylase RimI-like enzyme
MRAWPFPHFAECWSSDVHVEHANVTAGQLHKSAVELSVLKTNTPALKLYEKHGFRKKQERRRSLILIKDVKNT